MFAFRQLESGGKAIVPDIEGEMAEGAGNSSGGRDEDNGDGDDMESSGSTNSQRVEGAWLSTESQHMCRRQRIQDGDSPMLSRPHICPTDCPYGVVRRRCQHRRLKFEATNVSQMHEVEKTYLGCTGIMQPC